MCTFHTPHEYLSEPHLRTLEGIKDGLLAISDCSSAAGYEENEADMHTVCNLADAIRDAIVEYQVRVNLKHPISWKSSLLTPERLHNKRLYMTRIAS